MNSEEIIDMARQAGLSVGVALDGSRSMGKHEDRSFAVGRIPLEDFVSFIQLVDAKATAREREACAKVCEDLVPTYLKDGERWLKGKNGNPDKRLKDIAPNLEAAWEAEQLLKNDVITFITEAHLCANAIRNRGDL